MLLLYYFASGKGYHSPHNTMAKVLYHNITRAVKTGLNISYMVCRSIDVTSSITSVEGISSNVAEAVSNRRHSNS